ncbi:MAG TPA: transketolase, partial [Verrucomicrobia bacterium]|nr:transketolase [Verrucomicrobiota bacterium]
DGVRHEGVAKGGYVIYQSGEQDEHTLLFIASGSEVSLALEAAKALVTEGRAVRVVSMPSMELFLRQPGAYRDSVIPGGMPRRIIVEAGVRFGWDRFRVEPRTTRFVTMDDFGASAPYRDLAMKFGFTVENVIKVAKTIV